MTFEDYPQITEFRFHLVALIFSENLANIDGATGVMNAVTNSPTSVPPDHPEYAPLMQAAEQRRSELRAAGVTK